MITRKDDILRAPKNEIIAFFRETTFQGVFSHEVKSKKYPDSYKGCITDITLAGKRTDITKRWIHVPKDANEIPEGRCIFRCTINLRALRESEPRVETFLDSASLKALPPLPKPGEVSKQELFEVWGVKDCECIGYCHYDADTGKYIIDDLRKPNFATLGYYPCDLTEKPIQITYNVRPEGITEDGYYLLTWKLLHKNEQNPYQIVLDYSHKPRPIEPKWFINTLFHDRHSDTSKNFGSATNFLDTLSKQLSAKDATFIYELLQNANDYPVEGEQVEVAFYITEHYLLFLHSGDTFNVRNISGICGINEGEKVANKKTIGYKGIGFKTVFRNSNYVYIRTGDYSFRFDANASEIKRQGAPWPILPVWTEENVLSPEVTDVFNNSGGKYRVQIALRPTESDTLHKGKYCYEQLFRDLFADANVILFIPNIRSVRVVINGQEERYCQRDSSRWIVNSYDETIPRELQKKIDKTIEQGGSRIPEKYKSFAATQVSFACQRQGNVIVPIEHATLYCYLPTSASWGLPFLMNTDMIPKGDRNDIETEVNLDENTNFNGELAAIAGAKLFSWIYDLLTSKEYDLGSVFALVPDFKKCIAEHSQYRDYLSRFYVAFAVRVKTEPIIPVAKGIAPIHSVIYDATGLSATQMMSDEEWLAFIGKEGYYLPLLCIRNDKRFNVFLHRYIPKRLIFDRDGLSTLISTPAFQEWLAIQDNNNRFLQFLLEKGYLSDRLYEKVFLAADGKLYSASDLFCDVDAYVLDLQAFTQYMPYLSPTTRQFFADNSLWEENVRGRFKTFDCDNFVNHTLLSWQNSDSVNEILHDKDASIHFYKFLSENVSFRSNYLSLPFISDGDEVISSFRDKFLFLSSDHGHEVCGKPWLQTIPIAFVSQDYDTKTIEYFTEHFSVQEYDDQVIVEKVILSMTYHDRIVENIKSDPCNSIDFVAYCYDNKELFAKEQLNDYPLLGYDRTEKRWWCPKNFIFFPSEMYDAFSATTWLNDDWMFVLDKDYYAGIADSAAFEAFLASVFGVRELTDENFYTLVVRPHLKDIFTNTSGNNDPQAEKNIAFVAYLDRHYDLIFERHKDYDRFNNFLVLSSDKRDISIQDTVYLYCEALVQIMHYEWFPANVISLCHKDYGASPALARIGCKEYHFPTFFDEVIVKNIYKINGHIDAIEKSISFHNLILSHYCQLSQYQLEKMSATKVFLYGSDSPVSSAQGHKLLSAEAEELVALGVADYAALNILDPRYLPESNKPYWEGILRNTVFTTTDFLRWVRDHTSTLCRTLADKTINIAFYRWVKSNMSEADITAMPSLPVILTTGTMVQNDTTIYFSDGYLSGAGIESLVTRYDATARFLSGDYLADDDDIASWKTFWTRRNIRWDIVDILHQSVIPHLADINDDHLVALLADNRKELAEHYPTGLIPRLSSLRVRAHDGNFYNIAHTIFVDCTDTEPFDYISLPNQISVATEEQRQLIRDVMASVGGIYINSLSAWRGKKIEQYRALQASHAIDKATHFRFINELAGILRSDSPEDWTKDLLLLNRDDKFCQPHTLTLGTSYAPLFDFECCGADCDFLSKEYLSFCPEASTKLFITLGVHCDFTRDDIPHLRHPQCATYLWTEYVTMSSHNRDTVRQLIESHALDNVPCIPTMGSVKAPTELYYGSEVERFLTEIEDYETKTPLAEVVASLSNDKALFDALPFKHTLDFLDALYALINVTKRADRQQLLQWMVNTYNSSYDTKIDAYRSDKNATWKNGQRNAVHISKLYALDPKDKSLHIFNDHENIIANSYLPEGDDFYKICRILKITIIHQNDHQNDITTQPQNDTIYSDRDKDLRLFALVIAGKKDEKKWEAAYSSYKRELDRLTLHRCSSIKIAYKKDSRVSITLGNFYSNDHHFYFVRDLDDKKVFQSFVEAFASLLQVSTTEVPLSQLMEIMDSKNSALEIVNNSPTLRHDRDFVRAIRQLVPSFPPQGRNTGDDDEGEGTRHTPTFDTTTPEQTTNIEAGGSNEPDIQETYLPESHPSTPPQPTGLTPQDPANALDRLRSKGTPLELTPLPHVDNEKDILTQYGLSAEAIADSNHLAMLRLHRFLIENGYQPVETEEEFARNATGVSTHYLKDDTYIHACSAAAGVMYISPSVWNNVMEGRCHICVFLNGQATGFHLINNKEELLELVKKDDVVLKLTGKEKVDAVMKLYSSVLSPQGTAYTLIRVAPHTDIDPIFAQYTGAMAEPNDDEDDNEYR